MINEKGGMEENLKHIVLRDRLRSLEIKIIDLAKMLKISRPTLYKYIECYEGGQRDVLSTEYLALFDYIMQHEFINAHSVLTYIFEHILMPKQRDKLSSNAKKDAFIRILLETDRFDALLPYLVDCDALLQQQEFTQEDEVFLEPLRRLYESLNLKFNHKEQ